MLKQNANNALKLFVSVGIDDAVLFNGYNNGFVSQSFIAIFSRGATLDDFSGQFLCIFEIIIFCFVVAICDLVHAVEAMYGLP